MKRLLFFVLVLFFYFIVAPAQSQTPSRKRSEFLPHSKRARFAKPPHPWLKEMEGDSSEMARQDERLRSSQPPSRLAGQKMPDLPPQILTERQWLLQSEAERTPMGADGLESDAPLDRLYPPHKWPLAYRPNPVQNAAPHYSAQSFEPGTTQTLSGGVQQAWVARYDGPGSAIDYARAMAVDAAGNIYVTGISQSSTSYNSPPDYLTVKYNTAGVQQWAARYNGPGFYDEANALAVDGTGNVYVTGSSGTFASYDYVTIKYNSAGTQQWTATYNGTGNANDIARAIGIDAAGNVYVTGSSWNGTNNDYATIKYNSAGTRKWVKTYNGPENKDDVPAALVVDGAGNAYVTGYSFNGTNYDYTTIKYNSAGAPKWVATDNGPRNGDDYAGAHGPAALGIDTAGNVYVTGPGWNGRNYDYATIKYNSTGVQEWVAAYNGPRNKNDYALAIAVDGEGNVYVTGASSNGTYQDYATVKYNSAGTQKWVATYNGPRNKDDVPYALAVDGEGNVYVTGVSSNGYQDYATVKYNSDGSQKWVATYNGPVKRVDYASAIGIDAAGNVYVTGTSEGLNTNTDFATIKYRQILSADAGPDKTICADGSVSIGGNPTGSGGPGSPYTFNWTPITGLDNLTVANPIASPATTTTYTVTVTETATGLTATDTVTVTVPAAGWSVAHIVDVDDVIFGVNQGATSPQSGGVPGNNRSLAFSPDERFLYLSYILNKYLVRKIDLSVADPADNHSAVVAQLLLSSGSQPARDIATDDRGRVYLALGTKIEVYNSNLQVPPLHTIFGFTACEGLATRRENGKLAVYATDRLDKTLERFVLAEGAGETIASSRKAGLDGDGEVRIIGAGSPRGLDLGNYGSAWIADIGTGKVYRVNAAGRTVDSTVVDRAMDVAIDTTRGEIFVSQYTRRTIKVLDLSTGKIKRTLAPPAVNLNVDLDGETGFGALSGIDVASCQRVFVANEKGRSILTGNPLDSPFSNVGDDNDVKAADTDPVLVLTGNGVAKEFEVEEPEVASDQLAVTSYQLAQNYPNPFSPLGRGFAGNLSTTIRFALPEAVEVSLKIYDIAGQLVQALVEGVVEAGRHQVVWDGANQHGKQVASGVYFYQLRAGEFKQVRKMSLVR